MNAPSSSALTRLFLFVALAAPGCAVAPAADEVDQADREGSPEATRLGASAAALCFPPVYSGTVQVGTQYVSWPSPASYQSSCDGLFWTQATIGANTGAYKRFWGSIDMRTPIAPRDCYTARMAFQLWGKSGANWVQLNNQIVATPSYDSATGICRLNANYAMTLVQAASYSTFMLGGSATSATGTWPISETLGLDY